MMNLLSVLWDPSEILVQVGPIAVRWYAICWGLGLGFAYYIVYRLYVDQKIGQDKFDPLFVYCFFGILIGARLGHCLLYAPGYYLTHIAEMLLPIKQMPDGSWQMIGYAGLASHGGTVGVIVALMLYAKKTGVKFLHALDNISIATPITAACIRLGNLMNSEIVGKPTGTDWGFVFARNGEDFARHPGQLYEAIAYLILMPILLWLYKRNKQRVGSGYFFGVAILYIFTCRFFIEIFKEVQEPWELTMQEMFGINQGQLLSIPFMLLGVWMIRRALKK
jgi:prolipoprotein diacylglyceryl transferase